MTIALYRLATSSSILHPLTQSESRLLLPLARSEVDSNTAIEGCKCELKDYESAKDKLVALIEAVET